MVDLILTGTPTSSVHSWGKIWPCHSRSNVKAMVQLHQNYNNSQTIGCSVLILTSALTLSTWEQNLTITFKVNYQGRSANKKLVYCNTYCT